MQHDRWPVGLIAREAVRNTCAIRARLYPLVLLAAVFGVAAPLFAAWQSQQFTHQLDNETAAGRNLISISALDRNNPAQITINSCDALSRDADVTAAGAIEPGLPEDFAQLGTNISVLAASPTLLPALNQHSALIGPDLTHAKKPFTLLMPSGHVVGGERSSSEPDQLGTNTAVVVGLSSSAPPTATCYVKVAPTADALQTGNRLITELDTSGGALTATEQFTEPQNPITVFHARPDQYLPLLLGLAGGLAAGILNRLRSGEWASYRMSGTSPRSLRLLLSLEQLTVAGFMLATSALTALVMQGTLVSPASTVLLSAAGAAIWVLLASILSADLPRRKPTSLAKDR